MVRRGVRSPGLGQNEDGLTLTLSWPAAEFIERMAFEYGARARETGCLAASAAGFDSVPADMAVLYTAAQFAPPARCTWVEQFLTIRGGPSGFVGKLLPTS